MNVDSPLISTPPTFVPPLLDQQLCRWPVAPWAFPVRLQALAGQGHVCPQPLNSALSGCSTIFSVMAKHWGGNSWSHKNPSCPWTDSVVWTINGGTGGGKDDVGWEEDTPPQAKEESDFHPHPLSYPSKMHSYGICTRGQFSAVDKDQLVECFHPWLLFF